MQTGILAVLALLVRAFFGGSARLGWAQRRTKLAAVTLSALGLVSCGDEPRSESTGSTRQAMTSSQRILDFEGTIGGSTSADWHATATTVAPSSTAASGNQALAVSGSHSAVVTSAPLAKWGTIPATGSIHVLLPS
jgi:hypothetical protein